jgi:hypothetical protein
MSKFWCVFKRSGFEAGQSLPAALIALAVGALLLTPFLGFVSSRSLGTRTAGETFNTLYAADAGVEYAIWSLLNVPSFRNQADLNSGTAQNLAFPGTLNGITVTKLEVTALPIGSWKSRPSVPANIGAGGSLAYHGDFLYALQGGATTGFWSYNINTQNWGSLDNTPEDVRAGGALISGDGDFLYALRGGKEKGFWRFNTSSPNWVSIDTKPEKKFSEGADLVYTGGDNIYAFLGNNKQFWHYSISSDTWNNMTNAPDTPGDGSDLIYTGGNNIYALRGGGTSEFWHYDKDSDNWSTLANTPGVVGSGGSLAFFNGSYIYALQGSSDQFWRYTIATDSWSVLANAPAGVGSGADLIFTTATTGYSIRGGDTPDFWEFEVTPPRYDISVQAGSVTIDALIEINGGTQTILFWDIN